MLMYLPQVVYLQACAWWQRLCDWLEEPDHPGD